MKVSELFMPKKTVKKTNRDVHVSEEGLPKEEIKQLITIGQEQGDDYQKILKSVVDKFGPDAMSWTRRYMANVLSEK